MRLRTSKEERAFIEITVKELRRQINNILDRMDARDLQKLLWNLQRKER